jgi:hypothetical protein
MVDKFDIFNDHLFFRIEPNPDDSGIRVLQNVGERFNWIMTIIDNDNGFAVSNFAPDGTLSLRNFEPKNRLLNIDGTMPPLEVAEQVEVETPYNKKIIVRSLDENYPNTGALVAYSDGVCLYGIALCEVSEAGFRVALAQ